MRRWVPLVAVLFAACGSRQYAEERRALVEVGMPADEVRARFGAPRRVIPVATSSKAADQTTEIWECEVEAPPGPGHFAALVLTAGALIAVTAVAAKGGGAVNVGG